MSLDVAPHPFCIGWPALMVIWPSSELMAGLDFMEGISCMNNRKADEAVCGLGLTGLTTYTDSHLTQWISTTVTTAKADSAAKFLDNVAVNATRVVGTEF